MHVVIFEGGHWKTFAPLALGRPVFMLATGMSSLLEKQLRHLQPTRLTLWVRPELAEFCRARIASKLKVPTQINAPLDDEPALVVSGRTLHLRRYDIGADPFVVTDADGLVQKALVRMPGLSPEDALNRTDRWMKIFDLPRREPNTRMVERLWDLIKWNEESLIEDSTRLSRGDWHHPGGAFHMIESENVWIGSEASVQSGVVLDASRGPVVVSHHASIGANAVLQGPCFVGPYANVAPLSLIRGGTTIGVLCKVAGEVANSIFFGYTNKAHEGFIGDSYIGKWANLGAGTVTSNLKNTYGEITVPSPQGPMKTGRRFLGALIGDHVKTAIGTRLMAGSYVGFASMLASSAFAPRFVPSFQFITDSGAEPYRLDKAIEVMQTVFGRRNRGWEIMDDQIVRYVASISTQVEAIASESAQ